MYVCVRVYNYFLLFKMFQIYKSWTYRDKNTGHFVYTCI